jgi:hypothetical protein
MLVHKLDENLWVVRSASAETYAPCCYESREAALKALELPPEDRTELQSRVGAGVITYRQVAVAVAARTRWDRSAPTWRT